MTRKILLLTIFVAAALPALAAEHLLTPPAFEPMMAYYSTPAIATDGTSFLAAWVATPYDRASMLMVQRLGAPAPPIAIVTDASLAHGGADLVWSNDSYLLLWNRGFELHAMRLDRGGRPIDGSDHVLATDLRDPVVATNGTSTLVLANADYSTSGIVALTLDGADRVLNRRTIWTSVFARYDVTARSGGFSAAVADQRGVYAMRFDAGGALLDLLPRLVMASSGSTSTAYRPGAIAVASRGADTLIVWTMTQYQHPDDFFAAVLPSSGDVGARAALPHSGDGVDPIDVIGDGDGYSVLFSAGTLFESSPVPVRHLFSLRLGGDGAAVSSPLRVTSDDDTVIEGVGRLARSSSGYGLVWVASTGAVTSAERIVAAEMPSLGSAVTPAVLSRAATSQSDPSIASNGSGYFAAWLERSLTRDQIVAAPLDRNGVPGAPVTLFDSHFSYTTPPKVVFAGGIFLVAWEVDGAAWGVRLDAAGRALDPAPLQLSGAVGADAPQFDVTATSGGFFIAWVKQNSIYGALLTGSQPAPPQKLTDHLPGSGPNDRVAEFDPHVAFNGSEFLLAYTSTVNPPCFIAPCQSTTTWQMIRLDTAAHPFDVIPRSLDAPPLAVVSDGRDFAVLQFGHVLRVDPALSTTARIDFDTALGPAIARQGSRLFVVLLDVEDDGAGRATAYEITPAWTFGGGRTAAIAPRVGIVAAAANVAGDVMLAYARRLSEEPFFGAPRAAVQPAGEPAPVRGRAVRHP